MTSFNIRKMVSRRGRQGLSGGKSRRSSYVVVALVLAVFSKGIADETEQGRIDFVIGNFEFVLLHELAHVVIGDNDVPLLGPIEVAADYLATMLLLKGDGSEEAGQFLDTALYSAATSFSTSWDLSKTNKVPVPYWGLHALSIQRYYSTLCLLYGSDPVKHIFIELDLKLPRERAAGCPAEYENAKRGLEWLLDKYARSAGAHEKLDISFLYNSTTSDLQASVIAKIRELELLENTVHAVAGTFSLKGPFDVRLRSCGRPEALWQPERRELLICYELFDAFGEIYDYNRP